MPPQVQEFNDSPLALLLAPAALVLEREGYRTIPAPLPSGQPFLLAENALFLIGVIEFAGASDIQNVEAAASIQLADRLSNAGPKSWDAYLVLLSAAAATERGWSEDVTDILYNTSYLRRIVRWGVTPDEFSLVIALRPFLPLPPPSTSGPIDPMSQLIEELPAQGVDLEVANTALAQWRTIDSGDDA